MEFLHECLIAAIIAAVPMAPIFICEDIEHKKDQHTFTR